MLSVIIPTRNRSDLLKLALQSLQSQTLPADSFEVIVIDNGSTDNTKQVVTLFQQQSGNIRYFFEPTPGLHVGRHLGMKKAKSDILVYADDDIEAFPTWLEGVSDAFCDEKVALVGGRNLPRFETEPAGWIKKWWNKDSVGHRTIDYLSVLDLGDSVKEISPYQVYGCNFSIRKAVLLEAGGFNPDGFPHDLIRYRGDGETAVSSFVQERNYKTVYHPKASIYHIVPSNRLTISYFCQRTFNQGISDSYSAIRMGIRDMKKRRLDWRWSLRYIRIGGYFILGNYHRAAKSLANLSYKRGYKYHQLEAKSDPELLKWILRDNYFDKNGIIPEGNVSIGDS